METENAFDLDFTRELANEMLEYLDENGEEEIFDEYECIVPARDISNVVTAWNISNKDEVPRKNKKSAKEYKIDKELIDNKNVSIRVGTVTRKTRPETIYITASFWIKVKPEYKHEESRFLRSFLNRELQKIYAENLKPYLEKHPLFPKEIDNLFIREIPENINYNDKRNFIRVELYVHTINPFTKKRYPLDYKKNTKLYTEAIKIGNMIGNSDILSDKSMFNIHKTS